MTKPSLKHRRGKLEGGRQSFLLATEFCSFEMPVARDTVIEQDSERIRILKACHEGLGVSKQALALGGHFGRDKTCKKISERYFWKGIRSDVEDFVSFTALLMYHAIVYILHLKSPCICVFQPRSISHSLE